MAADLLVLRAARNAYLLLLLALVGTSSYQFATTGGITPAVALLWIVGAGGFYLSKWYYRRTDGEADGDSAPDAGQPAADNAEAGEATGEGN